MRFANPAGFGLLALAIPVILMHVLRPRRRAVTVSSTLLWRRLERPVAAANPWQRLRWSLLLVAQLLAVLLLAVAVARPERTDSSVLAEHTVFIIDSSGSMAATDGTPDRAADAVGRALELRDDLPAGGVASVVVAGDTPRAALTASSDAAGFERSLRTIDQSQGHPDFADAFALAQSLDTGATPIGFVFITDGGLDAAEAAALPPGTRVERVGTGDTNRAITRLQVDSRSTGLHARVSVRNSGGPDVNQTVRVDVDGITAGTQQVAIGAGEQVDVEFDLPPGDLVEAFLEGDDLLHGDDRAVAVVQQVSPVRVLLAGDGLFWEELLQSVPGVTVERATESAPADGFDLAIYDGVAVPTNPGAPFIAVAPPGGLTPSGGATAGSDGVTVTGEVELPAVALVRTTDALLQGLDLSDVAIASAQRVDAGSAEVLVAGEEAPLLLRGQHDGFRFVYLTFGLRDSNLGVQVAFPLLADRMIDQLGLSTSSGLALTVGDALPVPVSAAETVTVVGPDARPITIDPGQSAPRAWRSGFFTVEVPGRPALVVAVNRPPDESELAVRDLVAPAPVERAQNEAPAQGTSLLTWVLWPLLAIVVLEAILAWRAMGVGRTQRRAAVGARVVVAALVVVALVDPRVTRSSDHVATVFVIDASASVGGSAAATGTGFVTDALGSRPDGAQAGVVLFGADARVDQIMGDADSFGSSSAVVDSGATDVAGGLRLAAALLPADARRRIVVVSDGRANTGDVTGEIEKLAAAGVPVDVVTLDSTSGADVAVASIDLPDVARSNDAVPIVVQVEASEATTATVVLRRDRVEVARQEVELQPGRNTVRFDDTPGGDAGAVMRYEATVQAARNTIAENDTAFAAVAVEGPARVLVIEGTAGESATLVAALDASGIGTRVIGVGDVPGVQELITYAGIVMVDVDARTLSGEQIAAITSAVRDLGRGLVTIGGERSYGVGGYLESPLNDLLPVDSEIVDPTRRRTVAEVLSIDTSESMGACHCAGNGQMASNPDSGGVNKTDISRAAAERTIEALAANDQVGVLAWNSSAQWVVELQALPPADVIDRGLRSLQPAGNTNIRDSLGTAAEALIASDAELKHIILFSDGFTDTAAIDDTAEQAAAIYEEHGITVSVLATGEGAAPLLESIAVAGHGRFYAGTDLDDVPKIMAEEAVIASRNFITEGEFLPEVTSDDAVVAALTAAPPLFGYVATTAKGQATTLLRIGPDRDPLLTTWQAGLGRVTSWTSDVTNWTQGWAQWDGFVGFFSNVVKDTLASGDDAGAVQANVEGAMVRVRVGSATAFPDGATATANVSGPDGQTVTVPLDRVGDDAFEGVAEAPRPGTYAVGAVVSGPDGAVVLSSSTLASNSYPAEYVPGPADPAYLARLATSTGGRAEVEPAQVWDTEGLRSGRRVVDLLPYLLLAAALLWPIAVALSRFSIRGATATGARDGLASVGRRVREALPAIGGRDPDQGTPGNRRAPEPTPRDPPPAPPGADDTGGAPAATPAPDAAPASTLSDLLARKRERQRPDRDQ